MAWEATCPWPPWVSCMHAYCVKTTPQGRPVGTNQCLATLLQRGVRQDPALAAQWHARPECEIPAKGRNLMLI